MARENTTSRVSGSVPINQIAGTLVCSLTLLPAGRYRVWGHAHHTLANGVRLVATGASNFIIANVANISQDFGPIIVDLNTNANTILLELQVATGAAETALGAIYAQVLSDR